MDTSHRLVRPVGSGDGAFRLCHELEGLLEGIAADREINADETARLKRWLAEAEPYRSVQPFRDLAHHIDLALSDGVLTLDECEDLRFVAAKLTTVNPYFNQLRGGIQQLMGLLAGIAADRRVHPREVAQLRAWADDWEHLKGLWPFDECEAIVTSILSRDDWTAEAAHLLALSRQFPVAGELDTFTGELPPPLIGGVCAVDPDIRFDGCTFVVTGESMKCCRDDFHTLIVSRQGRAAPNVTKRTDYLVVCAEGSPYWAFSCYGRKVERAYELRRAGHHVQIVHEVDFWDAAAA